MMHFLAHRLANRREWMILHLDDLLRRILLAVG